MAQKSFGAQQVRKHFEACEANWEVTKLRKWLESEIERLFSSKGKGHGQGKT